MSSNKQIEKYQNLDIYISFNSNELTQSKQLNEILTNHNYNVFAWNGVEILDKNRLKLLINNTKLFICICTENYLKSFNCKFEINYAYSIGKPILGLIIDKYVLNISNKESHSIGKILFK